MTGSDPPPSLVPTKGEGQTWGRGELGGGGGELSSDLLFTQGTWDGVGILQHIFKYITTWPSNTILDT
jgi:hypothetical protein